MLCAWARTVSRTVLRPTEILKQHGMLAMLRWIVDRLGSRLAGLSVNHVVWLDVENVSDSLQPDPEFTFRFITADEVRAYANDPTYQLHPSMADRLAGDGGLCFGALAGGRLAAFGWYALGSVDPKDSLNTPVSLPPGVAYMYHGFTHPDFRGRRLHGLVMGLALRALAERGVHHLVSLVGWTNWASLRSCFRLGYKTLGPLVSLGRGRCRLSFFPRAAKRLGLVFGQVR